MNVHKWSLLAGQLFAQERTGRYRMCLAPIGAMSVYQGWVADCRLANAFR